MELFDELDCRGMKTGAVIERDEAHRRGVWHGAFHCCMVVRQDGCGHVLFQKRSVRKKIAPGKFDVSVGGHYSAGEDAVAAGPREIKEEVGLDVAFADLVSIGRRVFVYCFTPGIKEYEFQDVFLLACDINPVGLVLQKEEVDGVVLADLEQGIRMFAAGETMHDVPLYRSDGTVTGIALAGEDFVPCFDNYYLKLLLVAQRFLRGECGPLVI